MINFAKYQNHLFIWNFPNKRNIQVHKGDATSDLQEQEKGAE